MPGIEVTCVCSACLAHCRHRNLEQEPCTTAGPQDVLPLGRDDNPTLVYDTFELKVNIKSLVKMPRVLSRKTTSMFIIRFFYQDSNCNYFKP